MYERNAIVLERYFAKLFGYDEKNNIKNNYTNYVELVNQIEKYQESTQKEDRIITEYDQIVGRIKDIQKEEEILYKNNGKIQENRRNIFENIDENVENLKKKLEKLQEETKQNNDEMNANAERFISELNQFNEVSSNRNQCSRARRIIEGDYQKKLKDTLANINGINVEKVNEVKSFFKSENNIRQEVQDKINKNGSKEKIPFNMEAIGKAIDLGTEIEEKETEILCYIYDKTNRLLLEVKNDTVKLERHKKIIRDSESKLSFLNSVKDYLILFLDNERLNIVGGQKEHTKLMNEACEHLEQDLVQIRNLYNLLTKEIAGRATKKLYKDLYQSEYLYDLEEEEREFENNISKLNVIGTVIYPDYWRIEGMQKIFESFKESVTNVYQRDLTEFEPILKYNDKIEEIEDIEKDSIYDNIDFDSIDLTDEDDDKEYKDDDETNVTVQDDEEVWNEDEDEDDDNDEDIEDDESDEIEQYKENDENEIDQILGFYNFDKGLSRKFDKEETNDENNDLDEENDDYEFGFDEEDDGYENIDFEEEENENENENEEQNPEQEIVNNDEDNDNDINEEMFTYRGRKRKKK